MKLFVAALMFALAWHPAAASDIQACEIIRKDLADYRATGRPCPCPYSTMRNGQQCGNRSAWAKPEGRAPHCYIEDVTGEIPPNRRPNGVRQSWPDEPPCMPVS